MPIRIRDIHDMVPEIFLDRDFEPDLNCYDLEILPCFGQHSIRHSTVPTIFINTEPDVHSARTEYQHLIDARPCSVFAVTAWSKEQPWGFDQTVDYLSNAVYVTRRNSVMPRVTGGRKRWTANALFGGWMRPRLLMFESLVNAGVLEDTLVTFMRRDTEGIDEWNDPRYQNYQSPEIASFDVEDFQSRAYRNGQINTMIKLDGKHGAGWISHIIPYEIYNNTMVSIVTETANLAVPDTFYVSEKISKPLLLAQPFWAHGCQHYLARLQDLGFKTFSDFWDESYDNISDQEQRAQAMMDSYLGFQQLERQQKIDIVKKTTAVTEHNRSLIKDPEFLFGALKAKIKALASK